MTGLDDASAQSARRLTRRRVAAGALLAAACAIAAVVLLGGGRGRGATPTTGVLSGEQTTTVTRRTLTESSTVDGTLGYGATLELYDRLSGTFTWLPSVGATIARGGTLFRIDNLPVVLMYGSLPAYRALKEGVSDGPDVEELNRNLIDLGYDPDGAITDVERFGAATAAAVRRWQHAEGLPETGEVQLGRVLFAPSARRVTAVHVALGQDPPATATSPATSPETSPPNPNEPSEGHGKPKQAGKHKKDSKPKAEGKPKEKGKPREESKPKEADSPHEGSSKEPSSKQPEGGGSGAAAPEVVLTTTSTQQLVQLKLKAEQQQLAHIGEHAPVTLPGGEVVPGKIIEVGTVASEAKGNENEKSPGGDGSSPGGEGNGESATIPVTLALTRPAPRLDQAPVSVQLVKDVSRNVLTVPATALIATAGGGYAIQVLEGDRRAELDVTPGMFANGYVQVEGSGLYEGQTVIESE